MNRLFGRSLLVFSIGILSLPFCFHQPAAVAESLPGEPDLAGIWILQDHRGPRMIRLGYGNKFTLTSGKWLTGKFAFSGTRCDFGGDKPEVFFVENEEKGTQLYLLHDKPPEYRMVGWMWRCPSRAFVEKCTNIKNYKKMYQVKFSADEVSSDTISGIYRYEHYDESKAPRKGCDENTMKYLDAPFTLRRVSCPRGESPSRIEDEEYANYLKEMIKNLVSEASGTAGNASITVGEGLERIKGASCLPEKLITMIDELRRDPDSFSKCNALCIEWAKWVASFSNNGYQNEYSACMGDETGRTSCFARAKD